MIWILVILCAVLLLVAAGFWKFALGAVVAPAVLGFVLYYYIDHRHQLERSLIPPEQVELRDLSLKGQIGGTYEATGRRSYVDYLDLSGWARNLSPEHTLGGFRLAVAIRDCEEGQAPADCSLLHQAEVDVRVQAEPGAEGEFLRKDLYMATEAPRGRYHIEAEVLEARVR